MKMFFDRYDAGKQLAKKLASHTNTDSVVLALPRGGVLVGYEIATRLHLPLDVIITRKVGHPMNKEVAICAITEDGRRVCDDGGLYGIDEGWIENESAIAMGEVIRRRQMFGAGRAIPITDKTVIVTDDGIATGLSMKAALLTIHAQNPKRVILAIPVAPHEVLKELRDQVDEIITLDTGKDFRGAVGAHYTHFPEVYDKEVITCLKSTRKVSKRIANPCSNYAQQKHHIIHDNAPL